MLVTHTHTLHLSWALQLPFCLFCFSDTVLSFLCATSLLSIVCGLGGGGKWKGKSGIA